MKILFYDGILTDFICKHRDIKELEPPFTTLDAGDGPSMNMMLLDDISDNPTDFVDKVVVFTNSLIALDHRYGWNHKENHTDIYIWVDELEEFKRIDSLTDKEIRYAHHIEKMYLAGVFEYSEYKEMDGKENNK